MFKRFIDRAQVWLYLAGHMTLASLIGRWGTPPTMPVFPPPKMLQAAPADRQDMWTTADYHLPKALKIIDFDPTFRDNEERGIDVVHDVAVAATKLDVS
jgi:hypothetical protein